MYNTFMLHTIKRRLDAFDRSKPNLFTSLGIILLMLILTFKVAFGQTNPTPQSLPYSQNFTSFTGSSTTYPAGIQGWTISGSLSTSFPTTAPNADQTLAGGTNATTSAGVYDMVGKIGLLSTGSNMRSICLSLNTTGYTNINVSFTAATQRNENTRVNELGVQYRIGVTGTFTNITSSTYQNTLGPSQTTGTAPQNPQTVSFTLPAACDNQSVVQLRWVIRDVSGSGARPSYSVDDISINGTPSAAPTYSFSPSSLSGMTATTPSAGTPVTTTISGSNLVPSTGSITVNAPTNFQVSKDGVTWGTSALFDYTGGGTFNAANNTVYFRIAAGAPVGTVSGTATTSGGGVTTPPTIPLSGTVLSGPTITTSVTALPNPLLTTEGNPSPREGFNVSGTGLTGPITVGPVANFEFSLDKNFSTASTTLTFGTPPTVTSTPVYVRIRSTALEGTYNVNIPVSSPSATTVNVAATGVVFNGVAAPFTAGNIVAYRVGYAGGPALNNRAHPTFLVEFTPGGVPVQTVALPLSPSGTNRAVYSSATATSEAVLTLSPDGQYLCFSGYDARKPYLGGGSPPTGSINTTDSDTCGRVAGFINAAGTLNTSTRDETFIGPVNKQIRSALTLDGNNIWIAGNFGIRYLPVGGTSGTVINTTNSRNLNADNSNLHFSSQSGSFIGLNRFTGLPTTSATATNIAGLDNASGVNNPYSYVFLDRDPAVPGSDVVYIANEAGGIRKYSFNGSTWTARGQLTATSATAVFSLTAKVVGTNVELYYTVGSGAGNTIRRFVDSAPYNANITSNGSAVDVVGTLVATAGAEEVFRGVAFAPEPVVPAFVNHTFSTPGNTNLPQGAERPIYRVKLDVTGGVATLTSATFQISGSSFFAAGDIVNYKLRLSTDTTLDPGDAQLGATIPATTAPQTLSFTSLAQAINPGTRYLLVTATVSGCAGVGGTLSVTSTPLANITYLPNAIKSGTPAAGGTMTIVTGTLENPIGVSVSTGFPECVVDWTNPSCSSDIIVVVSTNPVINTPTDASSFNLDYTLAPVSAAAGGGARVVYIGTAPPIEITNLTIGQTYYVKVFNRFGSNFSSGVQFTTIPDFGSLFAVTSGATNGAIWSFNPNATIGQTAASLGGFKNNLNITILSGRTVQIATSPIPARDIIVQAGAQLWRNSTNPTDMLYFTVNRNITCNGTIGNTNPNVFDAIGFNMEGSTCVVSGFGNINIGRMRKSANAVPVTNVTLNADINFTWTGLGAATYNNVAGARINFLIPFGRTINYRGSRLAMDGINGNGTGDRGGNYIVNGKIIGIDTMYVLNNNTGAGFGTNVTIGSTGSITASNVINSVTAGQGAVITINTGGQLIVENTIKILTGTLASNGGLRLRSTPTNTARVLELPVGASISGNVIVERFVVGRGWHFLGVPVTGQTIAQWNDDFYTGGPMPGVSFPNPGPNTSTIFQFNQFSTLNTPPQVNGWEVPTTNALTFGRGYRVWLPVGANILIDNVGVLQTGTINIPCDFGGSQYNGFNLISNPHASPIDFDLVTRTNVGATKWTYNPVTNQYETYTIPGIAVPARPNPDIIPSHQGFFVLASAAGNVAIPESAKSNIIGTFNRVATTPSEMLRIRLANNTTNASDETVILFNEEATFDYDPEMDAPKLMNPGMNLASMPLPNKFMTVSAMPKTNIVPLFVSTPELGTYSLSIEGLNTLTVFEKVFLRDNLMGTITELHEGQAVPVQIDNMSTAQGAGRFELLFFEDVVTANNALRNTNINLNVMPNPTASGKEVQITLNGRFKQADVAIYDLSGKNIMPATKLSHTLNVPAPLQSGIYVVKATVDGKVITQKLVVE